MFERSSKSGTKRQCDPSVAQRSQASRRAGRSSSHRRPPAAGNQALQQLLADGVIQPKLTVNIPGDKYEREADRVAEAVMRMPDPATVEPEAEHSAPAERIQRMCLRCQNRLRQGKPLDCPDCEEGLQRRETSPEPPAVDGAAEREIQALRGGGEPLPASVRSFFEPRFGRDFSGVRIHTGRRADEAAQAVNAEAFAMGQNVVFRAGAYAPGTAEGKQLLAHELTHVVQSSGDDATVRTQQEGESTDEGSARVPTLAEVAKAKTIGMDLLYDLNVIMEGHGGYVGSKYSGSVPKGAAPETISCIGLVLKILERTFAAKGQGATWKKIRSKAYKKSGSVGLKGTVLMEQLVAAGWKGIYWNPDTSRGGSHGASYRIAKGEASNKWAESETYYNIPVERLVTDYPTSESAAATNAALSQLEQLRFGVVAAQGGTHTAVLVNGYIYEVHWSKSCTDRDLIERSSFRTWSGEWKSGAVVVPPAEMNRVWGGGATN